MNKEISSYITYVSYEINLFIYLRVTNNQDDLSIKQNIVMFIYLIN